ncbi:MAG: dihydrofolate reductase [Betaproteobacteria bacterium]
MTTRSSLSAVIAIDRNRVIGNQGKLPWHLPADLKRFKALTMGHHIIMGRKTWESIGKPLPGRTSVVISRDSNFSAAGAIVVGSLAKAREVASSDAEAFVIGGAEIFRVALPQLDRLYLTRIDAEYAGDVFLPACEDDGWSLVSEESHAAADGRPPWTFNVYQRTQR